MMELKEINVIQPLRSSRSSRRRSSQFTLKNGEKKEASYSRLTSSFCLSDWIQKYCVRSSRLPTARSTFVDEKAVRRYTDNWQAVEEDSLGAQNTDDWETFFLTTGCMKLSHLVDIYQTVNEESASKEESLINPEITSSTLSNELCYINEWQRLWIFLENDEKDELSEYAPFFCVIIEILFHPRLQKLMGFLLCYNISVTVLVAILFPSLVNLGAVANIGATIFQTLAYFSMVVVYRGTVGTPEQREQVKPPADLQMNVQPDRTGSISYRGNNVAFSLLRKEYFNRIKQEIYILLCMPSNPDTSKPANFCCVCRENFRMMKWREYQQQRSAMIREQQQKRKLSYRELLNISLKFLIRVNGINPNHINFDRPFFRCILLFIVLIFPIYLFILNVLLADHTNLTYYCTGKTPSADLGCQQTVVTFFLTFGNLTGYTTQLLFGMSIMLGLSSLAYGAEIAYRLIDSFLVKFRSLRKVTKYDLDVIFTAVDDQQVKRPFTDRPSIDSQVTISSLHMKEKEKENDAHIKDEPDSSFQSKMFQSAEVADEQDISNNPLFSWVKRDAIEHYFFICEVFSASDGVWSFALLGIFLIGVIIMSVYIFELGVIKNVSVEVYVQVIIFMLVRFLVLFIYPIVSLCHANAYIYEMTSFFSKASKEDFQLIGGCQDWIDFTTSCPAAWTFLGLWITWDRLFGLLWTFAAGGIASGVAAVFALV